MEEKQNLQPGIVVMTYADVTALAEARAKEIMEGQTSAPEIPEVYDADGKPITSRDDILRAVFLTRKEAAAVLGITSQKFMAWEAKGWIAPTDVAGVPMFSVNAVRAARKRAEQDAKAAARAKAKKGKK